MQLLEMDSLDRQLLRAVQKDCSATITELAGRIPLTASAISRRLNRLKHQGILTGEVAVLSSKFRDSRLTVLLNLELERHKPRELDELMRTLRDSELVLWCLEISGESDLLLMLSARDLPQFNEFVDQLASNTLVRRYHSTFVKRHVKVSSAIPLD